MGGSGRGDGAGENAGGEDHAAAIVVEGNGEGEDAPGVVLLLGFRRVEEAPGGTVNIGLAGEGDGLENVAPVAHECGHLIEDAAAGEPVARLPEVGGGGVVAVEPDAVVVEYLDEDVGADGEGDARVEEVAGVYYYGRAAPLCFEGA